VPPVVLEIIVQADKGITSLKQFDKALSDTTKATQQQTTAQKDATQSSASLSSSLAQSAKSAVGLAAGFAGVAGIATTLSAAATAATGFEAALNAINALGTVSAGQLSKLREQLLALPPALGSSTELAKGLYDILGANVPADNAITVLTRSAELAKGGLGNLDTAINAVTKSAAAFGIPLSEAQYVTDVFTQTVVKGQGRLEEFAQAFPQVAATAAATGATFIDTNAAIAVLTQTFKNADTAATGLNSFFQQLIQNSAKFAAEGINVKQVLAEEGLTGIFRRLNEVTGGSAERLKELINDSEGFRAALTLTGTQFDTFNETVASYANVTGLAQQAASKNLSGATASWQTLISTLERLVQEVAPPLLAAFTDVTRVITTLAADAVKLWRAFAQSETLKQLTADFQQFFTIIGQSEAFTALNANLLSTTGAVGDTYNAFDVLDQLLKGNVAPAIDFVTAAWDLLNAAFNYTTSGVLKLGQYLTDYVISPLFKMIEVVDKVNTSLGISDGKFSTLSETSAQLSRDLEEASRIFAEQADEFVLGTNRMASAQDGAKKTVAATTQAVQAQNAALPQQGQAASAAATQTAKLSEEQTKLNKALEDANNAATGLKATLEKLKLGDVIKAISTEELERAVTTVITQLKTMEESGKFSARQISVAYDDAAAVMIERFGTLPPAFQAAFDAMRARASTTADGVALAFERLGVQTQEALQKTAVAALADFQTIEQAGAKKTPQALLDAWLDVVGKINKGAFQTLPAGFQASAASMTEIARKLGVDLPKPIVDGFGQIALATQQAAATLDLSWLQTQGALERANAATQELTYSTKGLSESEIMLGHSIDSLGNKVNAYGNAVAETTKQTQALLNLQISSTERFATDVRGLLEQVQQARKEYFNILGSGFATTSEKDYFLGVLGKKLKILQDLLAGLGYDELGRPLAKTPAATTTPGGVAPTRRQHGGPVASGQPYLVGERGPELFVPRTPGTVLPTGQTQAPGRSITYNLVIHTQATDAATLARDLVPYLRQADLTSRRLGG
jgi:TP901 family phage tail tape measure protein